MKMCEASRLDCSGSKADMIERLTDRTGKTEGGSAAVSQEHLHCLTDRLLSDLCKREHVWQDGVKDRAWWCQQVDRLLRRGSKYADLQGDVIIKMCEASRLDCSGSKADMIARLTDKKGKTETTKALKHTTEAAKEDEEGAVGKKQKPKSDNKNCTEKPIKDVKPTTQAAPYPARALQIVALCIGVANYQDADLKLRNAAKDAGDLAAALRSRGVDVTLLQDPDINQLKRGVHEFCYEKITKHTSLAIFFYAGHGGLCVGSDESNAGKHFMMASCWQDYDSNIGGFSRAADHHGYAIEAVVNSMQQRRCALNLVIVDACRSPARGMRSAADEDDSSRAWGATKLQGGRNTLICNACKSLHTASDGVAGSNGLYTEALLKHMFNKDHPHLFRALSKANNEACQNSHGKQEPSMEVMDSEPFENMCLA